MKPAVKPGPSALTSARRHGVPKSRSSTNITVAADMLPKSRSTSRDAERRSGSRPIRYLERIEDFSAAGMTEERVDVAQLQVAFAQKIDGDLVKLRRHQLGNVA